ncbi:MAG: preprotein translocase subunit YajC [Rhodospirillaceae bacterium]|jgi:preprotein translocase subunit YajC|nr:preprotein translocase subunit YajC [Rhodospirillaceae bacterium]MBT3926515.1 preprotein translocase subunit YajC [Rhodospirillaceae bacterium]MBT4425384.1 preprotein translocase subunit YajC [Rhodospirillaceae bacterium]MBT5039926.1 preprotein translocase subunit YajC [Rhodospirillaceae bacterium]MBT5676582.1 preprotein translocase subunit YajC [Rhodospirillaceae bacterium]
MPRLFAKAGNLAVAGKVSLLGLVLFGLTACPQPGAGGEDSGGLGGIGAILPLVLIFVVFYFLLIRPQQKKQKAHRAMLSDVHRGDDIVTNGGIVGHVVKVGRDDNLLVEIAPNVRVRVMRNMISEVIRRPDPDFDEEDEDEDYEEEGSYEEEEYEDDGEFEDEESQDDSSEEETKK